jgi:hypothetical protein
LSLLYNKNSGYDENYHLQLLLTAFFFFAILFEITCPFIVGAFLLPNRTFKMSAVLSKTDRKEINYKHQIID